MEVFFGIHSDNPREGPGDFDSTKRAFESLNNLPPNPLLLDIGCGPGKQTFDLLEISNANIMAIDNHQPFLDTIQDKINTESIGDRLRVLSKDMSNLEFDNESFDVIWSEGAIYQMGFENGLSNWKKFLKPSGYIAVTEISWIKENPPQELFNFWNNAYPAIQSIDGNLDIIEICGYKLVNHFTLPESAWWDYYNPIIKKLPDLKKKYTNNKEALAVIEEEENEIELYRKYSDYYGYEFYIMKK
jgi:ubiquinone/menaquinone biosynthesis C-methylase UbiE